MRVSILIASVAVFFFITTCKKEPEPEPQKVLPVASFTTSADSLFVGDTVYFYSTCQNATSFDWDFGDNLSSVEENPIHVYRTEGEYEVVLTVSNEDGSDVESKSLYVEMVYPCWTKLANLPRTMKSHISMAYNNLVYMISGKGSTVRAYDPATDEWTSMTTAQSGTNGYAMHCEMDEKVYGMGGGFITSVKTVNVYDLETDSWSAGTPMNDTRMWGSAVSCNGKIYVVGGIQGWVPEVPDDFCTTIEVYDPITDTWTEKSCPYSGWDPAIAEVNGKIYVFGGYFSTSDGNALNTVYEYDPELNQWEEKSPLPTARWGAASVVLDDLIYVMGGGIDYHYDGEWTNDCNTIEVYDPSNDTWEYHAPMPKKRTGGAACVLDDMIYFSGGAFYTSKSYDNFHVYDPTCDAD